jgi:hypothetical protein
MTIIEITGGMLRAARSLTGMTQQEVADRAGISRPCLTTWEGSSDSVPNAGVMIVSSRPSRPKASAPATVSACPVQSRDDVGNGFADVGDVA